MSNYKVFIYACPDYDPDLITGLISETIAMMQLTKPIQGNIVIKPNLVMAHPKVATESYTRCEVIEGIIRTIRKKGSDINRIDIVEKSGLGITTATAFRHAGYRKLRKKYGVGLVAMEESRQVRVGLDNGKIHKSIRVAQALADRDFLIFAPKLKTNVLANAYSGALKLNIGSIDSKERMYHHNMDLNKKMIDVLEVSNPDLIVTDGIRFAFGGNQMTQHGIDLGVLAISANAVAHDMVCAKMLNLDPFQIEHIKEAIDRGYGPKSFGEIEVLGDLSIEDVQKKTKHLDYGFYPVDQFKCNFKIISGTPYCTGGCQGIFLDWLHMVKDRKPKTLERFPKLTALVGKVTEKVEDKTVLLIGDCAQASSNIHAKRIVRIKGCPPTHKRIVWDMMINFLLLAPLVRPSLVWDGFGLYPLKKIKGWLVNLKFRPRQRI
ncbi:MAG: DUF362 domain-containing protein [Candidatus Marinimicrobia bacterium]|nr:DUF362 domain-containing protein [Candidatus Neomarinimicrobiota bacterium]